MRGRHCVVMKISCVGLKNNFATRNSVCVKNKGDLLAGIIGLRSKERPVFHWNRIKIPNLNFHFRVCPFGDIVEAIAILNLEKYFNAKV